MLTQSPPVAQSTLDEVLPSLLKASAPGALAARLEAAMEADYGPSARTASAKLAEARPPCAGLPASPPGGCARRRPALRGEAAGPGAEGPAGFPNPQTVLGRREAIDAWAAAHAEATEARHDNAMFHALSTGQRLE